MKKYNTIKRYFEDNLLKFEVNIDKFEILPQINATKILKVYENDEHIGLVLKSTSNNCVCNHCAQTISRKKGYISSVTTHGKFYDKILLIKLLSQRYLCPECKKITSEKLLSKGNHKILTLKSISAIINTLKIEINQNYSSVARKFKISKTTIINIFDKYVVNKIIDNDQITSLCIDENKVIADKEKGFSYQLIVQNPKTGEILDIVESRKKEYVFDVLSKYPKLETLSIDFWNTYKNCALELYPNLKIVPDNFHAVRNLTWAFDRTRRAVLEALNKPKSKNWRLYSKTYSRLNIKSKSKVITLLRENKELIPAYLAKEISYKMFNRKNTVEQYYLYLEKLKNLVEKYNLFEFKKPLKTLKEWEQYIVNIFEYKELSNGLLERINSSIKYIKRTGRGYRNIKRLEKLIKLKLNKNSAA